MMKRGDSGGICCRPADADTEKALLDGPPAHRVRNPEALVEVVVAVAALLPLATREAICAVRPGCVAVEIRTRGRAQSIERCFKTNCEGAIAHSGQAGFGGILEAVKHQIRIKLLDRKKKGAPVIPR